LPEELAGALEAASAFGAAARVRRFGASPAPDSTAGEEVDSELAAEAAEAVTLRRFGAGVSFWISSIMGLLFLSYRQICF
jgi:hypothetical protein